MQLGEQQLRSIGIPHSIQRIKFRSTTERLRAAPSGGGARRIVLTFWRLLNKCDPGSGECLETPAGFGKSVTLALFQGSKFGSAVPLQLAAANAPSLPSNPQSEAPLERILRAGPRLAPVPCKEPSVVSYSIVPVSVPYPPFEARESFQQLALVLAAF